MIIPALLLPLLDYDLFDYRSIIFYSSFALLIIGVTLCIRHKLIYIVFNTVISFLFVSTLLVEAANYLVFKSRITESEIYVILETNRTEAFEFVSNYTGLHIYLLASFFGICLAVGVFINIKYYERARDLYQTKKIIALYTFLPLALASLTVAQSLPYKINKAVNNFIKERKSLKEHDIKATGLFENLIQKNDSDAKTIVIIIGESTTRNHMGVYGYYRNTTPNLSNKRQEIFLYQDVITPHTHTIEALGKALTLEDYSQDSLKFNHSIVQLFNSAGYTTIWISNQKPIGIWESSTRLISKVCNESIFTDVSEVKYDEEVLLPYREALNKVVQKKVVFVHLVGTHLSYEKRYPKDFEVYTDQPMSNFLSEKAARIINSYDNAILYNDYIVNELIESFDTGVENGYLLYFSDHGEDVYEMQDNFGHTELRGTWPMYNIPFLIKPSERYLNQNDHLTFDETRPYSTEQLIHTIADLSGIRFDLFDSTKSLVNHYYVKPKRTIKDSLDYDLVYGAYDGYD